MTFPITLEAYPVPFYRRFVRWVRDLVILVSGQDDEDEL